MLASVPRHLRLAAVACISIALLGCGGSASPTLAPSVSGPTGTAAEQPSPSVAASPTDAPSPTAAATVLPTATPAPTAPTGAFSLSANVWWSGFEIAVSSGAYDAVKHTLTINATFKNTGTQGSELRQLSDGTTVAWSGGSLPGFEPSGIVAPGATANAQIQVAVPAAFVMSQAVLTFGKAGEHQAQVPLNGDEATSERPSPLSIVGKLSMGKYVTYTITSAMLVPASCSGYPDRIKYGPQKATLLSIVVYGTAKSTDSTNYRQIDNGYLVLPDATKVVSNPAMSLSLALNAVLPNEAMCFAVTPPFEGTYTLKMHEYRSNGTGSLVLQLQ